MTHVVTFLDLVSKSIAEVGHDSLAMAYDVETRGFPGRVWVFSYIVVSR